jgi:hypothetical protein
VGKPDGEFGPPSIQENIMFDQDTDLSHIPWQLLIRARTVSEIDAVVSSVVLARVAEVASVEVTRKVAVAASEAAGASPERASAEQVVAALVAAADFDDWYCGTVPHRPWPRHGDLLDNLSDPIASIVFEGAQRLVGAGGSETLQKTLGQVLTEVA